MACSRKFLPQFLLACLLVAGNMTVFSQKDSLKLESALGKGKGVFVQPAPTKQDTPILITPSPSSTGDSTKFSKEKVKRKKSPTIALALSAAFPGAGQIYNGSWWKAPIVWGALGGVGYWIFATNDKYQGYRQAYLARVDDDPLTTDTRYSSMTDNLVKANRDAQRSNLETSILVFSGLYILNIAEAFVDAHLKEFDVSDDLSMKVAPTYRLGVQQGESSFLGVGLRLKIKPTKEVVFKEF